MHSITLSFSRDQIMQWHRDMIRSGVPFKPTDNVMVAIANLEFDCNWRADWFPLWTYCSGEKLYYPPKPRKHPHIHFHRKTGRYVVIGE